MSVRKPAGVSWESFVDRQIREAQERGEFDDLPGAGKPLPDLDRPHDELWWLRRKLRDENLTYIPPSLQVRKDLERARERIAHARSEQEVRRLVTDINTRIRTANRTVLRGPSSSVVPLDEERPFERGAPIEQTTTADRTRVHPLRPLHLRLSTSTDESAQSRPSTTT